MSFGRLVSAVGGSTVGAVGSRVAGAVIKGLDSLPWALQKKPLKEFISAVYSDSSPYTGLLVHGVLNYKLSVTDLWHEYIVIVLADQNARSPKYVRIERAPTAATPQPFFQGIQQLLNSPHPRANDTYVIADSLDKIVLGEKGPAYTMVHPIPVRDLAKMLAVFQVFSPDYNMGSEQCFWLCSCVSFILEYLFYRESEFTRAAVTKKLAIFRAILEKSTTGTAWGIRLNQDYELTQLIAEISSVFFVIDGRKEVIPINMERDWRVCGYTRPLQVAFYSCEVSPLRTLAAKGLALSVGSTVTTYIYVTKWEVISHLFTLPDVADVNGVTHQALFCMVRASHRFAQNVLRPGSVKPDASDPPPTDTFPPIVSSLMDDVISITDSVLQNPVLDPAVQALAQIIGASQDGCKFVIDERPTVITMLLDILSPSSTFLGRILDPLFGPSSEVIEATTHAIRNLSMIQAGHEKLNQAKAIPILKPFTSSKNQRIQQNATVAITSLSQAWASHISMEARAKSFRYTNSVVRKTLNILTFDRPASVEKSQWIADKWQNDETS